MRWLNADYDMAYIYARGYFDGRTGEETALDWMTSDEVAVYCKGYDKGELDENNLNHTRDELLTCNVSGDVSLYKTEVA